MKHDKINLYIDFSKLHRYFFIAIIVWTILTLGSLFWDIYNERQTTMSFVKNRATIAVYEDQAIRLWATSHGGVYVPPGDTTPPNPFLGNIPDRDVVTISGKALTLMNPAYIIRQITDEYKKIDNIKERITSLKTLNPKNSSDEWECRALESFDKGVMEVSELANINGESYFRLMRPMITHTGCLKCHSHQGYKKGDIQGGVSVSVPMSPYLSLQWKKIQFSIWTHCTIFFTGIVAIGFVARRSKYFIIELKQSEYVLRKSEEKYKTLTDDVLDGSEVGMMILDAEYKIVWMNHSYERFFGVQRKKVIGMDSKQIIQKHIRQSLEYPEDFIEKVFATYDNNTYNEKFECLIISDVNHEKRWLEHRSQPIQAGLYSGGRIEHYTDITEQKRIEEDLRSERDKLQCVLSGLGEGMLIINKDFTVEFQNNHFKKNFGDAIGKPCYSFYMGYNHPCDKCPFVKALQTKKKQQAELIAANGHIYEISASPFMDSGGRIKGISLIRDITEKKKLQAEAMRTSHLASLGELAAGVAHEINNPVNGIINYAQIQIDQSKADIKYNDTEIPKIIIKEGRRIAATIKNLLSFSRGTKDIQRPVAVYQTVTDALDLVGTQLKKDSIKLKTHIQSDIPLVMANTYQIQQVILNIISNARYALNKKYDNSDPDKIIEISVLKHEIVGHEFVRLIFHDHGTGISNNIIDKICDPFFSNKPLGEGIGLGLSISHEIIKKHNGRLFFESMKGFYTMVIIDLPAYKIDE